LNLDPRSAALFAMIGLVCVLMGALLTIGPLTVEQRGTVLAGVFAVLAAVAWRGGRRNDG